MEEPRHLKRGLKDISALFRLSVEESKMETPLPSRMHSLSLLSPEVPHESLHLSSCLAAQLQELHYECILFPVGRQFLSSRHPVRHFDLSLKQFDEICHHSLNASSPSGSRETSPAGAGLQGDLRHNGNTSSASRRPVSKAARTLDFSVPVPMNSGILLFDFDYSNPLYFEKIVPVLDQWILLIKPEQESLCEGYKFIKASVPLNRDLEYFIVLNEAAWDDRGILLFEKFSDMVSRRLGLSLHWLGYWDRMNLEPLRVFSSGDSVEKRVWADFVHHNFEMLP